MHTDYLKYGLGAIFKQCFTTSHNSTTWKESWKPCLFFFFFLFFVFKFFLWEKLILSLKTAKLKDYFIKSSFRACISSLLSKLTHHLQNVHREQEYVQPDLSLSWYAQIPITVGRLLVLLRGQNGLLPFLGKLISLLPFFSN